MASRVTHFDVSADDPLRAKKFYEDTFGWEIKKWQGGGMEYWLVMTGPKEVPGIDGGISKRMDKSIKTFVNTIVVPDIDEAIKKVQEAGGKILMQKDELKDVGLFAQFEDTEGNIVGLMESTKQDAKM